MKKLNLKSYDLKSSYLLHYQVGLILSLSIITTLFRIDISSHNSTAIVYDINDEIVFLEETIQTKQEIIAPPPPRPVVPIEVPNDEIIEDEIIFEDSELHFDEIMYLPPPPEPIKKQEVEEEEVFIVVEQPPVLIGGLLNLQRQVRYPKLAIDAGIEGRVVVEFIITTEGNVIKPRILRSIGGGCDEEAVRVIRTANFEPGMQRGKKVAVRYSIPISFKLAGQG